MISYGKERYRIACDRFLEQHPEVQRKLDFLNPAEAQVLGLSIDDYQQLELNKEFKKEAKLLSIDSVKLVMRYAADSKEEFEIMLKEYYKKKADDLWIPWEEFCRLNKFEKWL
jgi:hypothetical protein